MGDADTVPGCCRRDGSLMHRPPDLVLVGEGAKMGILTPELRMDRPLRLLVSALALLIGLTLLPARGQAAEVDLALVLAVDISNSMDPEEQELQRQGFVEAFRSPLVHDAIRNGMLGRVAVTYMEWAGSTIQHVVVPWMEIEAAEDALELRRPACPRTDPPRTPDLHLGRHRLQRRPPRPEAGRGHAAGDRRLRRRCQQSGPHL